MVSKKTLMFFVKIEGQHNSSEVKVLKCINLNTSKGKPRIKFILTNYMVTSKVKLG